MAPHTADSHARSADGGPSAVDRRDFLGTISTLAMASGLAAGYGTIFVMAGQYLYPEPDSGAWYFVDRSAGIEPGGTISYQSPRGVTVIIKRRAGEGGQREPAVEDFIALSSVCPHLGCRVHWEAHNDRFFCPCHNGVFDPSGRATGGPPAAANQSLPTYPLRIDNGLLFIRIPARVVATQPDRAVARREQGRGGAHA